MNEGKKNQNDIKERLRELTHKSTNDNIKSFIYINKINDKKNKNKNILDSINTQLQSLFFTKINNNQKNVLKNMRLNEIFDKNKKYYSSSFIKKYKEVFDETFNIDKNKDINSLYNTRKNDEFLNQLNSTLFFVNKIKKINGNNTKSKSYREVFNNFEKINKNKEGQKNNVNNITNSYSISNRKNKITNYYKLNKLKNELYKKNNNKYNINRVNSSNISSCSSKIINTKKGYIFRKCNEIIRDNYNKSVNYKYYDSAIDNINIKSYKSKNQYDKLFSLRKKDGNKKMDFFIENNLH